VLFKVAAEMTKPIMANAIGPLMWYPRSLQRSLEYATANETSAPKRYGGAVSTRVIVRVPRFIDLTILR
jgi:hypothetical protein